MDQPQLQVGVKALLYNKQLQFLLIRRSATYGTLAGQWDIPGGRIKPGATLQQNLIREIKEETNLEIAYEPVLLDAQDIIPDSSRHIVRLTYLTRGRGQIALQDSEADSYQWVSWPKILQIDNLDPYLKKIVINSPQPIRQLLQSQYVTN